jgi:hypothetical protein
MTYDPDDYDEVYETKSEPEKAQLVANGWVLLDERLATAGGPGQESFMKTWGRSALSTTRTDTPGYVWRSGTHPLPKLQPPQEETTYVLGWPKGQQTIGEDEVKAQDGSRTIADTDVVANAETSIEQGGLPDTPGAPTAPTPPKGLDEI